MLALPDVSSWSHFAVISRSIALQLCHRFGGESAGGRAGAGADDDGDGDGWLGSEAGAIGTEVIGAEAGAEGEKGAEGAEGAGGAEGDT